MHETEHNIWPKENLEGFHKVLSKLDSIEFYSVLSIEKKENKVKSIPKSTKRLQNARLYSSRGKSTTRARK